MVSAGVVEGRLISASRYWFKVRTADGVAYVNKAHIVLVRVVEGPKQSRPEAPIT